MNALGYLMAAAPTPTPTSVPGIGDTVSLAGPWQWTLPLLITVLIGAATAVGVVWTLIQKHRADRRQQLWNRMQWALDALISSDPDTAMVGALAVNHLVKSSSRPKGSQPPIALTQYDVDLLEQALEIL